MSANATILNRHATRVLEDSGDISTVDMKWAQRVYDWLVDNGLERSLLHWAGPQLGVKKSGSNIQRIYDLGSTWLPRTADLTPRDSTKTTYNATGVGGFPAFVNADGSSQLYWGRGKRFNTIQKRQQITIVAMYERTQTASDICFVGTRTSSTISFDQGTPLFNGSPVAGISLKHTSGSPGTIQFGINDKTFTQKVATVTSSGATTLVAVGTYDGTTMTAYSNGTAGSGVTTLFKDPLFASDSALAGDRNGARTDVTMLAVGDTAAFASFPSPNNPPPTIPSGVTFANAQAQFKASDIIVLAKGLTSAQVTSLTTLLTTRGVTAKNIKTDYSASGSGQVATMNLTIPTSGNNKRLTTSSPLTGIQVGHVVAFTGANTIDGSNPMGSLGSTVVTVNSSTDIILNDPTTLTLTASSQSIEWGPNDSAAFASFKTANAGLSGVELTIPAGRYMLFGNSANGWTWGINGLKVIGAGSSTTIISDLMGWGGANMGGANGALTSNVLKIASANAGDTSVTLLNPSDASFFTVGGWAMVCGLDVQGYGDPPNWHFHEFVQVIAKSGAVLNLAAPLMYSYLSTWPEWVPGTGGPASIVPAQPGWDCDHEYSEIQFLNTYTVANHNARNITLTNCTYPRFGPNCSTIKTMVLNGCSITGAAANWEIDKLTGDVIIDGGTYHSPHWQSCSQSGRFTMRNATVDSQLNGTGLNVFLDNCTGFPNGIGMGVGAYGVSNSFQAINCSITGPIRGPGGDPGGLAGDLTGFSMSGGVLTRRIDGTAVTNAATAAGGTVLNFAAGQLPSDLWDGITVLDLTTPTALDQTPGGRPYVISHTATSVTLSEPTIGPGVGNGDTIKFSDHTPPYWAVPGKPVFWARGGSNAAFTRKFQVVSVAINATHSLITTDEPGGFPTLPGSGNHITRTHPAPVFRMLNCTGHRDAVALSGWGIGPVWSQWGYTFNTNIGTTQENVLVMGKLTAVTITINTAFGAGTLNLDNPFIVNMATGATTQWFPVVDLSRGPRTITITEAGVTSTPIAVGGADSGLAFPLGSGNWLMPSQVTPKMSGVSAPGSVTLQFQADQGIPMEGISQQAPAVVGVLNPMLAMRLRLHG